jgi:hypothetical protein
MRRPILEKPVGLALLLLAAAGACRGYIPARFAARPPITDARDENPGPLPEPRSVPEPIYLAEVYLHRPLRDALSLEASPPAKDINALDEVPRSSWFVPRAIDASARALGPEAPDAPRPPFVVLPDPPLALASPGLVIRDALGQRYEVALDPGDRPEMRTGALAVAARLVWALGFNTPPVLVTRLHVQDFQLGEGANGDALSRLQAGPAPSDGARRVAVVAWPEGRPLGRSPETGTRGDDPNDVIAHEDRRTMRALKVVASWLALGALGPAKVLDRYIGLPGEGHVQHYLVGLDDALGASKVVRFGDPPPELPAGSPFMRLITLGLGPSPARRLTPLDVPAVGALSDEVDPERADLPLPYAPADRLQGSDGYWMAKRIARLCSSRSIALAIEAGKFSDRRARQRITRALEARGRTIASHWFSRVVPVELVSFSGARLELRDEAINLGLVSPKVSEYRFDFMSGDGQAVAESLWVQPRGDRLELVLPDGARRAARDYLVVQILARRAGRWLPRTFELHVRPLGESPRVVGIRH